MDSDELSQEFVASLLLAAKGAGYCDYRYNKSGYFEIKPDNFTDAWQFWSPHTSNNDSFSLMVRMAASVDCEYNGGVVAGNADISFDEETPEYGYQEGSGKKDLEAAARWAILKFAIAVGKKKK